MAHWTSAPGCRAYDCTRNDEQGNGSGERNWSPTGDRHRWIRCGVQPCPRLESGPNSRTGSEEHAKLAKPMGACIEHSEHRQWEQRREANRQTEAVEAPNRIQSQAVAMPMSETTTTLGIRCISRT